MKNNSISKTLAILVSLTLLSCAFGPIVASAQTTPPANTTAQTTATTGGASTQNNAPTGCSISWSGGVNLNFTACIWIPLMSWLGSWFLTIGAFALVGAGVLFDLLVQYVVIQFGTTLTAMGALGAITTGWDIFRDLSNIIIIGMFTFIAISIILGNKTYGEKKMIARVLIVAVLINFSLLFAKIVIDVGNYTSYQIYSAMASSQQFQGSLQGLSGSQFDIAGAFLRPMGITSVWNTQGLLQQFGQTANSGVQAFAIGLVGGLLLLMLAFVLLYGCFLIAARAITLVILMVTASIAFASYLHPALSQSQFGWKGWWKSLLNASLFGPLLMIFLAFSLLIVNGANCVAQGSGSGGNCSAAASGSIPNGGLGGAVFTALTNPSQTVGGGSNGWTVVMLYIFGIGLLYISFKLASSFASSAGGLNLGQDVWNKLANSTSSGFSSAGRLFGQQTGGKYAYRKERDYQAKAQDLNAQAKAAFAAGDTAKFDKLTKKMNTAAERSIQFGALGAGYKKQVQEKAKKVAAVVQKAQIPAEERKDQIEAAKKVRDEAKNTVEGFEKSLTNAQKESKDAAKTVGEELAKEIQSQSAQGNNSLRDERDNRIAEEVGKATKENSEKMKPIENQLAEIHKAISASTDSNERQRLQGNLLKTEESRKSEMRQQGDRVEKARRIALLSTAKSKAAEGLMKGNPSFVEATVKLDSSSARETMYEEQLKNAKDLAKEVEKKTPDENTLRAAHTATTDALIVSASKESTDVANETRRILKTDRENGRLKKLLNTQMDEDAKKE